MTGDGIKDFFEAVEASREEYNRFVGNLSLAIVILILILISSSQGLPS